MQKPHTDRTFSSIILFSALVLTARLLRCSTTVGWFRTFSLSTNSLWHSATSCLQKHSTAFFQFWKPSTIKVVSERLTGHSNFLLYAERQWKQMIFLRSIHRWIQRNFLYHSGFKERCSLLLQLCCLVASSTAWSVGWFDASKFSQYPASHVELAKGVNSDSSTVCVKKNVSNLVPFPFVQSYRSVVHGTIHCPKPDSTKVDPYKCKGWFLDCSFQT